jgi:hypothetical protein
VLPTFTGKFARFFDGAGTEVEFGTPIAKRRRVSAKKTVTSAFCHGDGVVVIRTSVREI